MTSLQGSVDDARVAEDREAVASDLLNILHRSAIFSALGINSTNSLTSFFCSIPIQSIATNGPSLVSMS